MLESLAFVFLAFCFYFAPALVAAARQRSNKNAIFVLNLFLGWTVLGWIIALIWSVMEDTAKMTARPAAEPWR